MTIQEKTKFVALRSLGNFLVLFSIYGVLATFGPAVGYEVKFRVAQARGIQFVVQEPAIQPTNQTVSPKQVSFGDILTGSKEQVLTAADPNFSILIPKIGASEKITPNVDASNPEEYLKALQTSVAHAKGSVFPGMNGTVYLFAHSTDNWWNVGRYNAVFYLLKDLAPGDQIVLFFEGKRFNYTVSKNWVGNASDVQYLQESQGTGQKLIMQTCWPPGTTWKRIFVEAVPASM